jgi:hypothetical protein
MQSAGISGMNTEGSRNGDGRSQGRGSRSNFSGYRSNQSAGGGLASRFSLAISKIIEKDSILLDEGEEDEDIAEVIQLVEELNQHTELTVKLNNQSKICSIFSKETKNVLLQKKIEQKMIDPQIIQILN